MQYIEPVGAQGPANEFGHDYVDKNAGAGISGSFLAADVPEHLQLEILSLIVAAGLTPSGANLKQLTHAVRLQRMNYVEVAGTANVLTADLSPDLAEYAKGLPLRLKIATTNTGAMTLNVDGLGAVALLRRDGTAIQAGDAVAGQILTFVVGPGNAFYCTSPLRSDYSAASNQQLWTASGTLVVPASTLFVEGSGGGGAGGASGTGGGGGLAGNIGGGGGGGGLFRKIITGLTVGSSIPMTIGAGGAPAASAAGGSGGTTSVGSHCSATGGTGGSWGENTLGAGGIPGTASGGDVNLSGTSGGFSGSNSAAVTASDTVRLYGRGGVAAGGLSLVNLAATGADGIGFGSGGSGASGGAGIAGGAGRPGYILVRW